MNKLALHGFNNLTKTLSFNIYDVCYAPTPEQKQAFSQRIDATYPAEKLATLLQNVATIIQAHVLNIARQDYDPTGASATLLVAEHNTPMTSNTVIENFNAGISAVGHLDKSHITAHTYPEFHPHNGIGTFRADIDVSTCGLISPLNALNYLIEAFDADVMTIDYRVRGFTRNQHGDKLFIDHSIQSIQAFIASETISRYHCTDHNCSEHNIYHTKMLRQPFDLQRHTMGDLDPSETSLYKARKILKQEMHEIFQGKIVQ